MGLGKIDEFGLIRRLTRGLPRRKGALQIGIGDDAAIVRIPGPNDLLVTTDMLIEGRHFRIGWSTMRAIGRRALFVNISDIAAMGGTPRYAVIAVGIPKNLSLRKIEDLFAGIKQGARQARVLLIGGDTNRSQKLTISVTVLGEVERRRGLTRSGAHVGDLIYVTGRLGEAALFLKRKRFLEPPVRVGVGRELVRRRIATSCIDLSDGFLADLNHILEASGFGAEVQVDSLPGRAPLSLKMTGGEDYELLFTAPRRVRVPSRIGGISLTRVGKIIPGRGKILLKKGDGRRIPLPRRLGFTHF